MVPFFTGPNNKGILVMLAILAAAAVVVLFARALAADTPAEMDAEQGSTSQASEVEAISEAIFWLVTPPERFDQRRARVYYGTRTFTDEVYRGELSVSFIKAGNHFDLPKYLLVTIGYRESIFRPEQVGDGGKSLGIMQVGKYGRMKCKEYCKEVDTVDGGIMCGGCWLDAGRSWCGDLMGGLNAYCHGECQAGNNVRGARAVKIRTKLWGILKSNYRDTMIATIGKPL